MRKRLIGLWFTLAILSVARAGFSQGTLAPLYVFTNGDGTITQYQSGQMLEAGQTYNLTAVPDAGYEFSSWQPVDVFIITQTNYNQFGDPILPPVTSTVPSVVLTNIYAADLEFTMQDAVWITPQGEDPNVLEAFGWQADFVPVPEPADLAMIGCSLAIFGVVRRGRWRKF